MSEDDIIDRVERIADFGWSDYDDFPTNKKAVQGILDLYKKQKTTIEKLENIISFLAGKKIITQDKHSKEVVFNFNNKWVSKDKIKAKIKEREHIIHNSKLKYGKDYYIYEDVINAREEIKLFQELLEEQEDK